MISVKIDVTKIDKTLLFKGAKGTYLDVILRETPGGQYGDWMVLQDMPKERRDKGERGVILGNGKNFGQGARPQQFKKSEEEKHLGPDPRLEDDEIPF